MAVLKPIIALALLAAGLSGCEKESAKAVREADMVERSGTPDDKCAAKRRVAEAFLREGNERDYSLHKSEAESFCMNLDLSRRNGRVG